MLSISVKEFLFWKKKQLSKGGDNQAFALLIDCIGGISTRDLNLLSITPDTSLYLKKNLDFLESIWEDHLFNSSPIQHLCGVTFWRDLKLKVSNKVLIPRPETELIIERTLSILTKKSKIFIKAKLMVSKSCLLELLGFLIF